MMMETMEIRSGDDDDYNNKESSCCPSLGKGVYCVIAVLLTAFGFGVASKYAKGSASSTSDSGNGSMMMHGPLDYSKGLPQVLFDERKYSTYDFENELGIKPAFWGENETCVVGQCQKVWGPCYASINPHWANKTMYHLTQISAISMPEDDDLSGYCRPGFLIIGQGKCGTSSLYHYINGHPRVLPANEKQIHYFKVCWKKRASRSYLHLLYCVTLTQWPSKVFHPIPSQMVPLSLPHHSLVSWPRCAHDG